MHAYIQREKERERERRERIEAIKLSLNPFLTQNRYRHIIVHIHKPVNKINTNVHQH
jgi:hypothetical protein